MTTNGPSPKRRRTDNALPTAQDIAQSNATLRHFTGAGNRQNRWMQGMVQDTNGGDAGAREHQTHTASSSGRGARGNDTAPPRTRDPHPTSNVPSFEGSGGPEELDIMSWAQGYVEGVPWANFTTTTGQANTSRVTSEEEAATVNYESPYVADASTASAAVARIQNARKSMEAQTRVAGTRQGLPSPAPSDENSNSPNIAQRGAHDGAPIAITGEANAGAHQHPQPGRASRPRLSMPGSVTVSSPVAASTGSPIANQQAALNAISSGRTFAQSRTRSTTGVTNQPSPPVSSSMHAPSPLQRQHQIPTPGATTRSPSVQVRGNTAYVSLQGGQGNTPVSPASAFRQSQHQLSTLFNRDILMTALGQKLQSYMAVSNNGQAFQAEIGRLRLLQEAVHRQDWFYIVLSQLSTLRTTSPTSMPQSMASVGPPAFAHLDSLLCANNVLDPALVKWFSEFPMPIMGIYSGPASNVYERQVYFVVHFLHKLARNWNTVVAASSTRMAPPLVQDMVDGLGLYSPALQTTAFRAIARTFWGNAPDVEPGIETLVNLHQLDQSTYDSAHPRTEAGKQAGYWAFKRVFDGWQAYVETAKRWTSMPPLREMQLPPFSMPPEAVAIFAPPAAPVVPSTSNTPPTTSNAQTQQQHAAADRARQVMAQNTWPNNNQQPLAGRQTAPQGAFGPFAPPAPPGPPVPRGRRRVLPAQNQCPRAQPTEPDSTKSALHQAHLRSPILGSRRATANMPGLYRHVKACALSPTRIDKRSPIQKISFESGPMDMVAKPVRSTQPGEPPTQQLQEGSRTYRLRCSRIPAQIGFPTLGSWVTSDCYWPDNVYFDINSKPLETRRKLHNGRFLPIDLTQHIKPGENELRVALNLVSNDETPFDFAVAVELVEVWSHEHIIRGLRVISAQESLEAIMRSLDAGNGDADGDLVMTSSTLTIKLFDPISSSKIFDTPVRGHDCLHRDAFDLETFLSQCKRKQPGWPTEVDVWRCPICRGDVRPDALVKDGFLVHVREQLQRKNLLETRAIVVSADGTWQPKAEERTGVRSPSLEREERRAAAAAANAPPKPAPIVIELD